MVANRASRKQKSQSKAKEPLIFDGCLAPVLAIDVCADVDIPNDSPKERENGGRTAPSPKPVEDMRTITMGSSKGPVQVQAPTPVVRQFSVDEEFGAAEDFEIQPHSGATRTVTMGCSKKGTRQVSVTAGAIEGPAPPDADLTP